MGIGSDIDYSIDSVNSSIPFTLLKAGYALLMGNSSKEEDQTNEKHVTRKVP